MKKRYRLWIFDTRPNLVPKPKWFRYMNGTKEDLEKEDKEFHLNSPYKRVILPENEKPDGEYYDC
jgi:hypothetical protein